MFNKLRRRHRELVPSSVWSVECGDFLSVLCVCVCVCVCVCAVVGSTKMPRFSKDVATGNKRLHTDSCVETFSLSPASCMRVLLHWMDE